MSVLLQIETSGGSVPNNINPNPGVHGETVILTDQGYHLINTLQDRQTNVWNGKAFSNVQIKQTARAQALLHIQLSNGSTLDCTSTHKFYLKDGKEIAASSLKPEDQLQKATAWPVLHAGEANWTGVCGFDAYDKGKADGKWYNARRDSDRLTDFAAVVPVNASLAIKLRWFEGYIDAMACTVHLNGNETVSGLQFGTTVIRFLEHVRFMLHTIGVDAGISIARTYGQGLYSYRLRLTVNDLRAICALGCASLKVSIDRVAPRGLESKRFVSVTSVVPLSGVHDTYCFSEPLEHRCVLNGMLIGDCTDIIE